MAKIIKPGNPNYDKPWVGYKASCARCTCVFELDADDKVEWYDGGTHPEAAFYETPCPGCKQYLSIGISELRQHEESQRQ